MGVSLVLSRSILAQKPPRITGTYTDMHYVQEAGDVLGCELKIVFTGNAYQGALQIAEGVPGDLVLVNIESKGTEVNFVIPESAAYAGRFHGSIENGVLVGEFRFKDGGSEKVKLRKGKSYWD